jgi:hypothetical protein
VITHLLQKEPHPYGLGDGRLVAPVMAVGAVVGMPMALERFMDLLVA